MVKRVLFTRHGETEDNVVRRLSTSAPGPKLTQLGLDQAINLAENISSIHIDLIYSSPLIRATQTAEVIAKNRNMAVYPENGFRELSVGTLEGRSDDAAFEELDEIWKSWTIDEQLDIRVSNTGESAKEILDRSLNAFENIIKNNEGKTVMIVAHSGILQLLIPRLANNIPNNFGVKNWLRNCQLVDLINTEGGFKCISWGDIRVEN